MQTHIEVELISGEAMLLPIFGTSFASEKLSDGSLVTRASVNGEIFYLQDNYFRIKFALDKANGIKLAEYK